MQIKATTAKEKNGPGGPPKVWAGGCCSLGSHLALVVLSDKIVRAIISYVIPVFRKGEKGPLLWWKSFVEY